MHVRHVHHGSYFPPTLCRADAIAANHLDYFRAKAWTVDCVLLHDARKARFADRFRAIDEETTAKMLLVLNNPVAAAVPADQEQRGSRTTRRGRFVHDTSLLVADTVPPVDQVKLSQHMACPARGVTWSAPVPPLSRPAGSRRACRSAIRIASGRDA